MVESILMVATDDDGVIGEAITARVGELGRVVRPDARTPAALLDALASATVVIGGWSDDLVLGRAEAQAANRVRLVQQPGSGVNLIDTAAWADAGVPVSNAPGGNSASVAEWAVTAAATLVRSVVWADGQVRAGRWPQESIVAHGCRDLGSCRVGIVGFGEVGRRAAALFGAFGCRVRYFARRERVGAGIDRVSLDRLLAESDVVVLALPLTDATRGLIGWDQLCSMPSGSILVNVARGAVVDEAALIRALTENRIGGAALDVFDVEPLPDGSPLRGLESVLLSPHVAGGSSTALHRIADMTARNVEAVLRGHRPSWVVNSV